MAAGTLATPGQVYGPCEEKCIHTDCLETRKQAAVVCRYCGDVIGYERRFYRVIPFKNDPPESRWTDSLGCEDALVHAICHESAIEA